MAIRGQHQRPWTPRWHGDTPTPRDVRDIGPVGILAACVVVLVGLGLIIAGFVNLLLSSLLP